MQKSRNTWLHKGDDFTKYFFAVTKQRRARNRITGLEDDEGKWVEEEKELIKVMTGYFKDLFVTTNPTDFDPTLEALPTRVTEDMNRMLTATVTEEEVRTALFLMHPEKAPGPDGMTVLFYQQSWQIIKQDLVDMVNGFLSDGIFDDRLNQTNICLIPKKGKPRKMAEFRPISLCNVGYKIISKVLCQRLKRVLPKLISETQSAFVAGRLISDNILIAQEMFHGLRTKKSCKGNFLAIKTDMSKAYDRVEWIFIEKLLCKMGFDTRWISWIMKCISSVSYKVLLNGQAQGKIVPERGLRQGDPLSPYLFILCTEVLIANIKKAELENRLTGIKVALTCPPISHLLFADDSLFFCKAENNQCSTIMDILSQYGRISGQQINLEKSSVTFGHLILPELRVSLMNTLGIHSEGGMGTYLGLPESLGGSKTKVFAYVRERLQDRTTIWSAKLLSKGGKEVLIKSVASALPNHVMSCFRLPKTITSKLTSAIARFWWSSGGNRRGLHWFTWKKLCVGKNAGGIGFRTIDEFNSALLAKQLWRLIQYPDSLLARVLKGRYYKNSNPMADNRVYSPSYGWTSIMSAKFILQQGLIKFVGNGNSISAWRDNWIPDAWPRPARRRGNNYPPNLMVNHMINPETKEWNLNLLNEFFDPEDVVIIRGIPISMAPITDRIGWAFTKSGNYTVKSGYWVAHKGYLTQAESPFIGPEITALQAQAWKIRGPSKLKHFLWQVASGCLSVTQRLKSRGINCDTVCPRCGMENETINHALFECPPALQTWALSTVPTGDNIFPTKSVFTNLDFLFWRLPEECFQQDSINPFPWILWFIWKARNQKVFKGIDRKPPDTLKHAIGEATAWAQAQETEEEIPVPPNTTQASIGENRRVICQVDGSWRKDSKFAGLGWCLSSPTGSTILMGAKGQRRSLSPLHAELEALIWAMECMVAKQELVVAFQTDCTELVKMVSDIDGWPAFSASLSNFASLRASFSFFHLVFIPRSLNGKADCLARSASSRSLDFSYVNNVPPVWLTKPFN